MSQKLTKSSNKASYHIYSLRHLSPGLLTSTLGVRAFLLHRGCEVGFSCLLFRSIRLHVGLPSVSLPAVKAVLMSVATVVSILATTAMSMASPRVAAGMVAMFLNLSLGQQARGLPSAGAPLVLLVLPIELSINQ